MCALVLDIVLAPVAVGSRGVAIDEQLRHSLLDEHLVFGRSGMSGSGQREGDRDCKASEEQS